MWIALLAALLCVIARAVLNVSDRHIFKKKETDFTKTVVYNSFFPFLVAFAMDQLFGERSQFFMEFVWMPGVILSALGAQASAYLFSYALKHMTVKAVAVSSKVADIFIPLLLLCFAVEINLIQCVFSILTTLLFVPILLNVIRSKVTLRPIIALSIILTLCFQAAINSYFEMSKLANTWPKFLSLMSCVLFWRTLFTFLIYFCKREKFPINALVTGTKQKEYCILFLRAVLAFFAQASFFYSITRESGSFAWPILNSTPLVACFSAHVLIGEKVGLAEVGVLAGFAVVFAVYGMILQ